MQGLSREARKLLTQVNRKPVQADGRVSKTASELETNLLVHVEQFHTASGAHARRLESWDHWSGRTGYVGERITVARAKLALDDLVASLNRKFKGRGRLPWHRIRSTTPG